jgi:hypothetical protein
LAQASPQSPHSISVAFNFYLTSRRSFTGALLTRFWLGFVEAAFFPSDFAFSSLRKSDALHP